MQIITNTADAMHGHTDYPHIPGYLADCPACEADCHCDNHSAPCLWNGHTPVDCPTCEGTGTIRIDSTCYDCSGGGLWYLD